MYNLTWQKHAKVSVQHVLDDGMRAQQNVCRFIELMNELCEINNNKKNNNCENF